MHNPFSTPTASTSYFEVPGKIESALSFIRFAHGVTTGSAGDGIVSVPAANARELTPGEQKVYDAALRTLFRYFNDPCLDHSSQVSRPSDDDPKERVPA